MTVEAIKSIRSQEVNVEIASTKYLFNSISLFLFKIFARTNHGFLLHVEISINHRFPLHMEISTHHGFPLHMEISTNHGFPLICLCRENS